MKLQSVVCSCLVALLGMSASTIAFAANKNSASSEVAELKRRLQELEQRVEEDEKKLEERSDSIEDIRDLVRFGTGPYFGLDATYDGSDLLINEPSINKDLGILRQNLYLNEHAGHVSDSGPRVQFSGNVEVFAVGNSQPFGLSPFKSAIGATADLDFAAQINSWWTGYIRFNGDVTEPAYITLDQSFIILGNLEELPTYGTLGRLYLPSGSFSTNMATSPVTRTLGRTKATAFVLGSSYEGFDAALFGYDGRTSRDNSRDHLDEWGAGLQYTTRNLMNEGAFWRFGAGYNSNIASSDGMTSSAVLGDFGTVHDFIPAVDIHNSIGYGITKLNAEYLFLTKSFKPYEISFNAEGAKPEALNVELVFEIKPNAWFEKPNTFVLNYGMTNEAVALGLPKSLYGGAWQVVVMKNTLVTIEYLHKRDYDKEIFYTTEQIPTISFGTNSTDNQIRGQVDVFF